LSSIYPIQKGYFSILENYFDDEYKDLKRGKSQREIINKAMRGFLPIVMDSLRETLFFELKEYWEKNLDQASNEIRKIGGLKAYYEAPVGYQRPNFDEYIRRVALYADTIIVAEPIMSILDVRGIRSDWIYHVLLYNVMELLQCQSLVETKQPILTVIPRQQQIKPDLRNTVVNLTQDYALEITQKMLEQKVSSWVDIGHIIFGQENLHDIKKKIASFGQLETDTDEKPAIIMTDEWKAWQLSAINPDAANVLHILSRGGCHSETSLPQMY
jgi:hypothetical protein